MVNESEPGWVNLDQRRFVRTGSVRLVPKFVRSAPPSVSFQCQKLKFFCRIFMGSSRYEEKHDLFLVMGIFRLVIGHRGRLLGSF